MTNNTNSAVKFLLIWVIHVSTLKGSSSGVSNYTLLITELQQAIKWLHSCLFTYYLGILTYMRLNIKLNNFF
jgi:hypothetical protein